MSSPNLTPNSNSLLALASEAARLTSRSFQILRFLDFLLSLLLFNEGSQHSYFVVPVAFKIEIELLAEPELKQVIVQRLLRNTYFLGCVL